MVTRIATATLVLGLAAGAQTTINGSRTIRGAWDASGANSTKPAKSGTGLPGTCQAGEQYFRTDASAGQNLHLCTAPNTWTQIAGGQAAAPALLGSAVTIVNPYQPAALAVKTQVHAHTDVHNAGVLLHKYKAIWGSNIAATAQYSKDGAVAADPGVAGVQYLRGVEETVNDVAEGPVGQHVTVLGVAAQNATADTQTLIDDTNRVAGVAGLNHPNMAGRTWTDLAIEDVKDFSYVEVYNAVLGANNYAEDRWDAILSKGRKVWGAAADDFKDDATVKCAGVGYIVVNVDALSEAKVLEAIRNGNFYAAQGRWDNATPGSCSGYHAGPDLAVAVSGTTITASTTSGPGKFEWVREGGAAAKAAENGVSASSYTLTGREMYVRVKFTRASDSLIAWSNPVFLDKTGADYNTRVERIEVAENGALKGSSKRVNVKNGTNTTAHATLNGGVLELSFDSSAGGGNVTGDGSLAAGAPVIGAGGNSVTAGTKSGNTSKFLTMGAGTPNAGDCMKFDANGNAVSAGAACGTSSVPANLNISSFGITIDGGSADIPPGLKGYTRVPFSCTIGEWTLMADQAVRRSWTSGNRRRSRRWRRIRLQGRRNRHSPASRGRAAPR